MKSNASGQAKKAFTPQIALQTAHFGEVTAIAHSPKGDTFVTAGEDGMLKLWEPASGKLKRTMIAHGSAVGAIAYSRNGALLASAGGADGVLKVWDAASGDFMYEVPNKWVLNVAALAFGSQEELIVGGSGPMPAGESFGGRVAVWSGGSGATEPKLLLDGAGEGQGVICLAVSPDGKTIATSEEEKGITLWDAVSGTARKALTDHTGRVPSLSYSPDGTLLASGGEDGQVKIRDAQTGDVKRTLKGVQGEANMVAFMPDGAGIVIGNTEVNLVNVENGTLIKAFAKETVNTKQLHISGDGLMVSTVGVATGAGLPQNEPHLWHTPSGAFAGRLKGYDKGVNSTALSADGNFLAVGNFDGSVRIWSARTGRLARALRVGSPVWSVAFSPDGKTLAVGSGVLLLSGEASLWDVRTGRLKRLLDGHQQAVRGVAFSISGRELATACEDGNVRLWNALSGSLLRTLNDNNRAVFAVAFSPDGRRLASGSFDRKVRLWDSQTGALIRAVQGHAGGIYTVAFSRDGKTIAGGMMDRLVDMWDVETGSHTRTLRVSRLRVVSVAFTPDSKFLIAGSDDGKVTRWDVSTGQQAGEITAHELNVSTVSVSSDGTRILSGSLDNTARLLDARSGRLMATFYSVRVGETGNSLPPDTSGATGTNDQLSGDYIVITPDGYYLASPSAEKAVRFRLGSRLLPANTLHKTYFRPDIVRKSLSASP